MPKVQWYLLLWDSAPFVRYLKHCWLLMLGFPRTGTAIIWTERVWNAASGPQPFGHYFSNPLLPWAALPLDVVTEPKGEAFCTRCYSFCSSVLAWLQLYPLALLVTTFMEIQNSHLNSEDNQLYFSRIERWEMSGFSSVNTAFTRLVWRIGKHWVVGFSFRVQLCHVLLTVGMRTSLMFNGCCKCFICPC